MAAFLDEPKYGMAALTAYLNGWAAGLAGRPHHLISYEHMLAEPMPAVAGILAFLGVEPQPEMLARAVAAAHFDRMRDKERDAGIPGPDYDRNDDQTLTTPHGKATP